MNIDLAEIQPASLEELISGFYEDDLEEVSERDAVRGLKRFFDFRQDKPESHCRNQLLMNLPDLKPAVCDNRENVSFSLIYHCLHSMEERLSDDLKVLAGKWTPLDTLRVTAAGSDSYQNSLDAFFKSAISRSHSPAEMAELLTRAHGPANEETQVILKIALHPSLIEAGFTEWDESAVEYYLARQRASGSLPEPGLIPTMQQLEDAVRTEVNKKSDVHRISTNLCRIAGFAETVAQCYPEVSPKLIKERNWQSCTRFLLAKFKLKAGDGGSCPASLTDYDELKIVTPGTEHWNKCLCTFVHTKLKEGHNLSHTVKWLMKGIIQGDKLNIATPPGMDEDEWTYPILCRFLEQQGISVAKLVGEYTPTNQSLMKEWNLYQNNGSVPFVDGVLIDYMNDTGFDDETKRRGAIKHFLKKEKFKIPSEFEDYTDYYQSLPLT